MQSNEIQRFAFVPTFCVFVNNIIKITDVKLANELLDVIYNSGK